MCNKVSYFNIWFILIKFAKKYEFKCKSLHFFVFFNEFSNASVKKISGQDFNITHFKRMFVFVSVIVYFVQLMSNKFFYIVCHIS